MIVDVASMTDVGLSRTVNQDSILSLHQANKGIFVVADGMGGHSKGEEASAAIVENVRVWWEALDKDSAHYEISDVLTMCHRMLLEVNEKIYVSFQLQELTGGSTCVVLIIWDDEYAILSLGDSRVYGVMNGAFRVLTIDDVWENLEEVKAYYSPEEIMRNPRRGKLTGAIGAQKEISVRTQTGHLKGQMKFLLCSDGIYKYCDPMSLEHILSKKYTLMNRCKRCLRKMQNYVVNGGAKDNYSAIMCITRN